MARGKSSFLASLVVLSAVVPALGQMRVVNPWTNYGPIRRQPTQPQTYHRQQQYYRPQAQYQPQTYHRQQQAPQPQLYHRQQPAIPRHWNAQNANRHVPAARTPVRGSASVHAAPPPTTTATPAEVEPLEIEGPTTTPQPTPAPYRPYQPPRAYNQQPARTAQWPANQPARAWSAARVMPAQPARPTNLRPQAAGQGHYGGYPATGQHAGYQRQQAGYQGQSAGYGGVPQAAQQPQRPGQQAANPLARYDVFSAQFDASAFQKAHQQAYHTTAAPTVAPVMTQMIAAAAGAAANGGAWSGSNWAQGFNGGFGFNPPTTKPPPPPTTTPDHRVRVNPYRHGGFFMGNPNQQARPKPVTQIIEINRQDPNNGVTLNPMLGWLGKTVPPPKKPTTVLPGKNGDIFSGFLGFNDAPVTPPPSKAINQINAKYQQYFAPVPVDTYPNQNTANNQNSRWGFPQAPQQQQQQHYHNQPRPPPARGGGTGISDAQLKREICRNFGMLCQ